MSDNDNEPVEGVGRFAARVRMPLVALTAINLGVTTTLGVSGWWVPLTIVAFVAAMALYFRVGTPRSASVDIGSPVLGRWRVVNSPSTKTPSHGVHAWGQTYACDLVADPHRVDAPSAGWWPITRRPQEYPGFGAELHAPVDGVVVRAVDVARDHWTRTSPLGVVYFLLEGVRELLGPIGILGNHLVIEDERGRFVTMAHLERRSIEVRSGQRVARGDVVARCGNSGNSTEPHLHLQVTDKASPWIGAAIPFTIDGAPVPATNDHLDLAPAGRE